MVADMLQGMIEQPGSHHDDVGRVAKAGQVFGRIVARLIEAAAYQGT